MLIFVRNCHTPFQSAAPCYFPSAVNEGSFCSTASQATDGVSVWILSILLCVLVSCCLNCNFLMIYDVDIFTSVYWSSVYLLSEVSVKYFGLIFNPVVFMSLNFKISLSNLDSNLLSNMSFANISAQSMA